MTTFDDALAVLLDGAPKFDLTESQIAVWRIALADVPPEALYVAAFRLIRESKYAPSIEAWRTLALAYIGGGVANKITSGEAWDEMRKNRKKYSPYDRNQNHLITWTSEAVRRAAEAVQWTDLSWTNEQIPTIRAQFERYYNALVDKREEIDAARETVALLPGMDALLGKMDAKRLGDGK